MTHEPDLFSIVPPKAAPVREYPEGVPTDVCDMFERLARSVFDGGRSRYSARAILHRIRWHHDIEKGDRAFKANNNWTPAMARWVVKNNPDMEGFFEFRERITEEIEQ